MHAYRTHTCGELRAADAGQTARLSGWVHSKRDHGGLLFIDLRDHYGLTQCVLPLGTAGFGTADALRVESVITVTGTVVPRSAGTINPKLPTGEVELQVAEIAVQSAADVLPFQVAGDQTYPEELRLRYRFLDLRREKLQRNMILRANVIDNIRRRMMAGRVQRVPDPDPDGQQPGGRPRLPGAGPAAPRQVLRPAAGAAAVQAAVHGGRLRPLLPDRAVLP